MSNKDNFSTQAINPQLISQIVDAIKGKGFGSVEIYIQNFRVVQITERTITKVATNITKIKKNKQYPMVENNAPLEN